MIDTFINLVPITLVQSLIYAFVALAIMIPFRTLALPDLTVEGSLPLGGCVAAALLTAGLARISQTTMDEGVCGGAGDVVGRTSFSDSGIKHVADDQDRTGAWQQRWWGLCELCGVWFVSVQRRQ